MLSMTGFGRGEFSDNDIQATAEVRSVNNRFLDIVIRLPKLISEYEQEVKELLRTKISRGRINVFVAIQGPQLNGVSFNLDVDAAQSYKKMLTELNALLDMNQEIRLEHLLNFSDIFTADVETETTNQYWACAKQAILNALDEMNEMRSQEGDNLNKDLLARLTEIEGHLGEIETLSSENVPRELKNLERRIAQIKSGAEADQTRLETEIALMADRLDVTEECVRFRSHVDLFRNLANGSDLVGRRLNFLLQEMNREANTISSKANHADISHRVVFVKEEVERLREQVQNIE